MINVQDHKTKYLIDPWGYLGPKRRKLLEESWAGLFRQFLLEELPVDKIAPFFDEYMGRPSKELYTALGVVLLQQVQDLTDEETVRQLAFNTQWHYALDIPDESDADKYISLKTLWTIRKRVIDKELDRIIFDHTTGKLGKLFVVDTSKQRLDSVHIRSNMQRLGRLRIFSRTIRKFLTNLKRQHEELFGGLEEVWTQKYLSGKGEGCFAQVKPSDSRQRLNEVARDLYHLVDSFAGEDAVVSMSSYKLLVRVLDEQCEVRQGETDEAVEVLLKPSAEIASDSLQNPSDPDATYDGHKGQGYQVQVMETYTKETDEDTRQETLNLITHVAVETACESDANALLPALESTGEHDLLPKEVLADSLYGSDENSEAAKQKEVDLVAPTMGKASKKEIGLSDFVVTDSGKVRECPAGHAPQRSKYNSKTQKHAERFSSQHCDHCPQRNPCPVKPGKKGYYLRYDNKALRIAKRRAVEQTTEFRDTYRWRAGVEGTMSQYDRRTGVKHLRVRGMPAVRMSATLKATGINLLRATSALKARKRRAIAIFGAIFALFDRAWRAKPVPNGTRTGWGLIWLRFLRTTAAHSQIQLFR